MELIDIGANLTHRAFDPDRDAVVRRALAAGVVSIIVTATDLPGSAEAATLASAYGTTLYCTAGVHPHAAKEWGPGSGRALKRLLEQPAVVAIGECGLDFFRDYSPRAQQGTCFVEQLQLASEVKRPVFLHERASHRRFSEILRSLGDRIPGGVVHCFTGGWQELRCYLDLGLHVGITGWICDDIHGDTLRRIVHYVPEDRLMIETDAPFLLPRTSALGQHRGRNEPAFLPHVLERVAACLRRDPAEIAATTTSVARTLFRLAAANVTAPDPEMIRKSSPDPVLS